MTNHTNGGAPDCVICAVRALTEGTPKIWTPGTPGQSVTGPVLSIGHTPNRLVPTKPFIHVDLWLGGLDRIRVVAFGAMLNQGIRGARPAVGDTLSVTYDGFGTLPPNKLVGRYEERRYRAFTVEVSRGHH